MSLIGGFAVPTDRFGVVLFDTFAIVVPDTETVLGIRISLLGGFTIPIDRFGVVLFKTFAISIPIGEFVLGDCKT